MKLSLFLVIVGGTGWMLFHDQFQSRLCSAVEHKCNCALAGTGIETTIGAARFFDGRGMLLSNMQLHTSNAKLTAYETFLNMPSYTTDLVTGHCEVDGVEMRRVQLELVRSVESPLTLEAFSELAAAIQAATADSKKRLIPIALLDSQIRIVDQTTKTERTISDINIRITPVSHEGRMILQVSATAASVEVQQLQLDGYADPESGEWNAQMQLNSAAVGNEVVDLMPTQLKRKLGVQSFSCLINGSIQVRGNWQTADLHWFEGTGDVSQINMRHERLPQSVHGGSANFQFSPHGATFENIRGNMGQSPVAATFQMVDLLEPKGWRFAGRIQNFKLENNSRTHQALPDSARRFLRDFQPAGLFNIQFDARFDGAKIRKTVDAQISDLSFTFNKFPYPMNDCFGTAKWVDDQITYDLRHEAGARVLTANGIVNNPGKQATWRCDLNVEQGHLPFDPKLQTAIDANPPLAKVVRAFNAHGALAGKGRLEKLIAGGPVRKQFDIDLLNLTLIHDRFPYRIENVKGKISSIDKSFRFKEMTGRNGASRIACDGSWNPQEGLNVRYFCNDIRLDERLRDALRTELQDVWDGFRPRGTVDSMTVDMTMAPGEKECNLVVRSRLNRDNNGIRQSDLSIFPTWFPYELNNLAGELAVGNGQVVLRDFRGKHGRTEVLCNGDGSYSKRGWDMRLSDMHTISLRADEQLLRALPESLARPIQYMKFDGLLNIKGDMTLAGQYRRPQPRFASQANGQQFAVQQASYAEPTERQQSSPRVSMGWDLRFDMNQAEMFLGIPVRNVFGMFKLIGQYDGDNVECRGSVDLDSLTIYDAQITKVRGPVWFDNYQALAGGMINQLSTGNSVSPSIQGEMYGGLVKLDAAISSDSEGRFVIHTSLADGNLKQLAQEFSPGLEDIEGHTFAALTMQGNASGSHTCRGNGKIELRDAKIYELPPVMRLLKLLQIRRVDDVAFDSGDIFFAVNGEDIDVSRMEFNGDAISIIGNGNLNLNHQLNLNFYSVMGRNNINIPLISDLYRRSSQRFMWIRVGGTCQNPKISREILPELNDSLKQLFGQETR